MNFCGYSVLTCITFLFFAMIHFRRHRLTDLEPFRQRIERCTHLLAWCYEKQSTIPQRFTAIWLFTRTFCRVTLATKKSSGRMNLMWRLFVCSARCNDFGTWFSASVVRTWNSPPLMYVQTLRWNCFSMKSYRNDFGMWSWQSNR
jgi:hypothetical protein